LRRESNVLDEEDGYRVALIRLLPALVYIETDRIDEKFMLGVIALQHEL